MEQQTNWDTDYAGPGTKTTWDRDWNGPGTETIWDLIPAVIGARARIIWRGAVRRVRHLAAARRIRFK